MTEPAARAPARAGVTRAPFGALPDGRAVELFALTNARGCEVRAMTYGGVIVSLRVPDRGGRLDDVVLGHDTLAGYLDASPYFGAIVGRCGNRIARGRFVLDGVTYQLTTNDGANHLHGGARGFDKVVWEGRPFANRRGVGVTFRHTSPDGDEGYPGTLDAKVTYTLTDRGELSFEYRARADRATPVNLTQHSYFNLAGPKGWDVLGHELTLHAQHFTPVDAGLVPTGAFTSVAGTPFDFRTPTPIGARVDADDAQLRHAGGYDHNFVLEPPRGDAMTHAARLAEPSSGRVVDVYTTEPGLQFYSGNFLDGSIRGKAGRVYGLRTGLCLETQHFPDSPNHPHFPSVILRPGATYRSLTVFAFGTA
ncbi:MAG TPA: aldose epimerase family protein [Gemmatimonadaceae bacterium]|nr:aldose epimerase family protein [Gemmatimonadaceae bacterium]